MSPVPALFTSLPTGLSGQLSLIQGLALSRLFSGEAPSQDLLTAHQDLWLGDSPLSQERMERLITAGLQSTAPEMTADNPSYSVFFVVEETESHMTTAGPTSSNSRIPILMASSDGSSRRIHSILDLRSIDDAQAILDNVKLSTAETDHVSTLRHSTIIGSLYRKAFTPQVPHDIAMMALESLRLIATSTPKPGTAQSAVRVILTKGLGHPNGEIALESAHTIFRITHPEPHLLKEYLKPAFTSELIDGLAKIGLASDASFNIQLFSFTALEEIIGFYTLIHRVDDSFQAPRIIRQIVDVLLMTGLTHPYEQTAQKSASLFQRICKKTPNLIESVDLEPIQKIISAPETSIYVTTPLLYALVHIASRAQDTTINLKAIDILNTAGMRHSNDSVALTAITSLSDAVGNVLYFPPDERVIAIIQHAANILARSGLTHRDKRVAELAASRLNVIINERPKLVNEEIRQALADYQAEK